MQADSPTTLVIPQTGSPGPVSSGSLIPIALVGGGIVVMVLVGAVLARRRMGRTDPRELAFRTIARKMGYTRQQIKMLRQNAAHAGLTSPIGLAVSPSLSAQILDGDPGADLQPR